MKQSIDEALGPSNITEEGQSDSHGEDSPQDHDDEIDRLKQKITDLETEIERLLAAVANERDKVAAAATELLAICDGSNWPPEAQSGVGFRLYTDLTDRLHEIANDLRVALTTSKRGRVPE